MTCSDWVQFGGVLFLGFMALVIAVLGPYAGDTFRKRLLSPKLRLNYKNEPPYCHKTKQKYTHIAPPEEFPTYYFRFTIENHGKTLARSCEVVLEEVWTADEQGEYQRVKEFWTTNLTLQGNLYMDINPGRPPIYVDIGHISSPECQKTRDLRYSIHTDKTDNYRFIFNFPEGQHLFARIDSRPRGKHLFKVAIVGENFEPIRRYFVLSWSGNWTEDEQQMIQKEAIIILKDRAKELEV